MAYFPRKMDNIERGCKVFADVAARARAGMTRAAAV
jgi:hypothetical protein